MLRYDATDIYQICNLEGWFTGGSNEQYRKVMKLADDGAPVETLALAIWLCTPDKELKEIKETMQCRCNCCDHASCKHRDSYRRMPKSQNGLGLCPNLI